MHHSNLNRAASVQNMMGRLRGEVIFIFSYSVCGRQREDRSDSDKVLAPSGGDMGIAAD